MSVYWIKAKGIVDLGCKMCVVHKDLEVTEKLKVTSNTYLQGLFAKQTYVELSFLLSMDATFKR